MLLAKYLHNKFSDKFYTVLYLSLFIHLFHDHYKKH